jgi:hypothetical protein
MAKVKKHSNNKNYTAVLLEEVRSDFKLIVENLDHVRKKGDATFEVVGKLQEDMTEVKDELRIIRSELKEKVGREEFKLLENGVSRLEKARV